MGRDKARGGEPGQRIEVLGYYHPEDFGSKAYTSGFRDGWEKHPLWNNYDLSVVTVCYNVLPDVQRTVESVLAHKGKGTLRIEHVVVDGASSDGTPGCLAQLRAEGKIEVYISERDKGIYDAMNKGIGLSHGKAIIMLNAGDTFLEETELTDYVLPIVRGETECVYGAWRVEGNDGLKYPCPQGTFIITPCCHQSFFLSQAAYRRVGMYDSAMRCLADGHLMWRAYAAGIRAKVVNKPVILFQPGGLSANPVRFMHEQVSTWYEHLEKIVAKARHNRDYACFVLAYYCSRCGMVSHYCRTGGMYPEQLLQQLCDIGTALADKVNVGFYTTRLLKYIVFHWLPSWSKGGHAGKAVTLLFHLLCLGLPTPKTEPYRSMSRVLPLSRRLARYSRSPYKEVFDYPCAGAENG